MPVLVDNRSGRRGLVALVRQAVKETLRAEGYPLTREVSVVLADDSFIQELNREYMGNDAPTDVLSFPLQQIHLMPGLNEEMETEPLQFGAPGRESSPLVIGKEILTSALGDIVVSIPAVDRQSREHIVPFEQELALLVIHAALHLIGYDHDRQDRKDQMWSRQDWILNKFMEGMAAKSSRP